MALGRIEAIRDEPRQGPTRPHPASRTSLHPREPLKEPANRLRSTWSRFESAPRARSEPTRGALMTHLAGEKATEPLGLASFRSLDVERFDLEPGFCGVGDAGRVEIGLGLRSRTHSNGGCERQSRGRAVG